MGYALALTAVFLFLCQFAFFRSALERIFSPVQYSQDSYNAIWGRTLYWDAYIAPMSGSQLLFGFGYAQLPEEYFTGLMELIYCSGLLGVVLYYFAMLTTALRCKGVPRITSVLLCGLMLVANTTSLISMTYYIGIRWFSVWKQARNRRIPCRRCKSAVPPAPARPESSAISGKHAERIAP